MFWRKAKTEERNHANDQAEETELKWPNTTPIDKTNPFWKSNNNLSVNGVPYKKEEVSPGKWQWKVDQESFKRSLLRNHEFQERKRALAMALQTRVLSDEEMEAVLQLGFGLFVQDMVCYREADKQREFNEAICQQHRLRLITRNTVKEAIAG